MGGGRRGGGGRQKTREMPSAKPSCFWGENGPPPKKRGEGAAYCCWLQSSPLPQCAPPLACLSQGQCAQARLLACLAGTTRAPPSSAAASAGGGGGRLEARRGRGGLRQARESVALTLCSVRPPQWPPDSPPFFPSPAHFSRDEAVASR